MKIEIGISEKARGKIAGELSRLLADCYTLYLKTHNFHWNVKGPMFQTLHLLFMDQYSELALAVDTIAERIRALGVKAPGSYSEFSKLSTVKEETGQPKAEEMLKILVKDNEQISHTARRIFPLAEEAGDQPTLDILTQRMQLHEKNAWMLRSHLE